MNNKLLAGFIALSMNLSIFSATLYTWNYLNKPITVTPILSNESLLHFKEGVEIGGEVLKIAAALASKGEGSSYYYYSSGSSSSDGDTVKFHTGKSFTINPNRGKKGTFYNSGGYNIASLVWTDPVSGRQYTAPINIGGGRIAAEFTIREEGRGLYNVKLDQVHKRKTKQQASLN